MPASRTSLALVLAAGEGTRMRSDLPKVLHSLAGRSLLSHVLARVKESKIQTCAVVVAPHQTQVMEEIRAQDPSIEIVLQEERKGTAHAVLCARNILDRGYDDVLVLFADTPLIQAQTLERLQEELANGAGIVVLGFETQDPAEYGRLICDGADLKAIREFKDAQAQEREIKLCNAGIMGFSGRHIGRFLDKISPHNAQSEYYLTDAVEIARKEGFATRVIYASEEEVMGVNDRVQLAQAEAYLQSQLRRHAMLAGVTLRAPETVFLSFDTKMGKDVQIGPHVVIGPGVEIGAGSIIHPFTQLEKTTIGEYSKIGPYARLRPGAHVQDRVKIGNFVELKAAKIGSGTSIGHLSYIGDANIGADVNIGAGTITCNYDGEKKHETIIETKAFIGSHSSLVAPVKIGSEAYVGSGSVITEDVSPQALAIGRGRQIEKPLWVKRRREAMKKE